MRDTSLASADDLYFSRYLTLSVPFSFLSSHFLVTFFWYIRAGRDKGLTSADVQNYWLDRMVITLEKHHLPFITSRCNINTLSILFLPSLLF